MKNLTTLAIAIVFFVAANSQTYSPLSYAYNGTPTHGVKIKTNLLFSNGANMPTIHFEGYAYGKKRTIDFVLNWYVHGDIFHSAHGSSSGGFVPQVKLANDNGKVSIYLDERIYFQRFNIRVFSKGMNQDQMHRFEDWTVVDEPISGTNIEDVVFENQFNQNAKIKSDGSIISENSSTEYSALRKNRIEFRNGNTHMYIAKDSDLGDWTTMRSNYGKGIAIVGKPDDITIAVSRETSNVGIGIRNATAKLHINGNTKIEGHTNNAEFLRFESDRPWAFKNKGTNSVSRLTLESQVSGKFFDITSKNNENKVASFFVSDNVESQKVTFVENGGKVGIGTTTPQNKLSVNGTIWAKEVKVNLADAADWVFEKDYNLRPLTEVESYIKENKHLPEIPSAAEFRKNDLKVSEITNKLLQKIEELTLYTIAQEKKLEKMEKLENKNKALEARMAKLEALLAK